MSVFDAIASGGQQIDPMQMAGEAMQLKNLGLQQQNAQLENQTRTLQNQQQQIALDDQKAMTAALHQWDGKDYNSLVPLVVKNGGSANAVMGLKAKTLEMQKQYSDIAAKDAETGSKNLDTLMKRNDMTAGAISNVMNAPDNEIGQKLRTTAVYLRQNGLIDDSHMQVAEQLAQMDPASMRAHLDLFRKDYMANTQQMAAAKDQADINLKNAEAKEKGTLVPADESAAKVLNVPVGSLQPLAVVKNARETANVGMETSTFNGKVNTFSKIDPNVPVRTLGTAPAVTTFNLNNPNPNSQQFQDAVDLVGTGKADLQTALSRVPAQSRMAFMSALKQQYPQFAQYNYNAAKGTAESAAYGDIAKQAQAFNTTIAHFGLLNQTVDALGNGNVQALNKLTNSFKTQFGGTAPTNFNIVKQVAADEFAKAAAGLNVAQSDREKADQVLNSAQSPAQLKQAIALGIELLKGKMDALNYTVQRGQNPQANMPLASPQAQNAINGGNNSPSKSNAGGFSWDAHPKVQ